MMKTLFMDQDRQTLQEKKLWRSLRDVDGPQGSKIWIEGKKVLNFCSNNYLGLANEPTINAAALNSIQNEGMGSGASRLICGNMRAHRDLENYLAKFKKNRKLFII